MKNPSPVKADNTDEAPFLRITNLTKKFGDFTALNNISLDIYDGELVCFLGPSGCGKTTLLRAIAGLDIQTSGSIEQQGQDVSNLPPTERDFGIVFQSYALFPNLTVERNVAYGLHNKHMNKADISARVDEMLSLVGLNDQNKKYPAQLSGGQQQRVALARALATSPGLLLLDEPLSALDAKVRARLRHEIKDLQQALGVTTIMVTHDQEEALTMADRIVVMNQGVIDQVGTPQEIYGSPSSPFVADFVGTMNFLDGISAGPGRIRFGDIELSTDRGDAIADGAPVTICIRPEDIAARDIDQSTENALSVIVQDLEFLGSFYRAGLSATKNSEMSFSADFSVNLVRDDTIRTGSSLWVALPQNHIHVFSSR